MRPVALSNRDRPSTLPTTVLMKRTYPVIRCDNRVELGGVRTLLNVPMIKDGEPIGFIGLFRQEVRPFTDKQIELVQNFAARLLSPSRHVVAERTPTIAGTNGHSQCAVSHLKLTGRPGAGLPDDAGAPYVL